MSHKPEIIAKSINGIFEVATRRRFGIKSQTTQVIIDLVIGYTFRKTREMKGYRGNPPDIVLQGASALTPKGHLLTKFLVNQIKSLDSFNRLFDQCRLNTFFHTTLCFKLILS